MKQKIEQTYFSLIPLETPLSDCKMEKDINTQGLREWVEDRKLME